MVSLKLSIGKDSAFVLVISEIELLALVVAVLDVVALADGVEDVPLVAPLAHSYHFGFPSLVLESEQVIGSLSELDNGKGIQQTNLVDSDCIFDEGLQTNSWELNSTVLFLHDFRLLALLRFLCLFFQLLVCLAGSLDLFNSFVNFLIVVFLSILPQADVSHLHTITSSHEDVVQSLFVVLDAAILRHLIPPIKACNYCLVTSLE